jgi:hypothetical protein
MSTHILHFVVQIMYQYYLLGFSNAYKTLYVHSRTIYVRSRTKINIPHASYTKENIGYHFDLKSFLIWC